MLLHILRILEIGSIVNEMNQAARFIVLRSCSSPGQEEETVTGEWERGR